LSPVTDAELKAYANSLQGPLTKAAGAVGHWFSENWEYVAGGAMVIAGGVLLATGVGGPVGGMLIAAGADTIIQKATTGEVNWGQVAVSGAFGAVGGGIVTAIGRHTVGNAVEGAIENIAHTAASGQPLTPQGLLTTAAEGAITSAATAGTLNKLPTAVRQLSDETPTLTSLQRGAEKVPVEWGDGIPNKKGAGTRWTDPNNPGNGIRIDEGVPKSPWSAQQVDHVVVRSDGQVIGRSGEPLSGSIKQNPVEAHIPLDEWVEWRIWNKP
jgi:hypothetical protein